MITLTPLPLTRERFAPYGDVIEAAAGRSAPMNTARFERFDDLCRVETDAGGRVAISIARCRLTTALPYRFDTVERHPHGSQAFVPLNGSRFVVVVAPPSESVEANDLAAFVTNGRQGVNYHRNTWHGVLTPLAPPGLFAVIDRIGDGPNLEEHWFDTPWRVTE